MEIISAIAIIIVFGLYFGFHIHNVRTENRTLHEQQEASQRAIGELQENKHNLTVVCQEVQRQNEKLQQELFQEIEKNKKILSQKKSSETRLGQISEHLVPFLGNFRHDPKNLHFLGNPIDYLAFDYDDGAIYFIEVKSGGSKATKRQKTIKNLIQEGRVFYEEIRINQKGIKGKVADNKE